MVIALTAAFIQGAFGFGFGLVALSLLALHLELKTAVVILALSGVTLNLTVFLRTKKSFSFERIVPMMIAMLVAFLPGFFILYLAPDIVLRRILGVVMLLTVVQRLLPLGQEKRWHPLWLGVPCGFLGGLLQASLGTGGPPVVAYIASQKFERHHYIAAVQAVLMIGAGLRLGGIVVSGLFTRELLIYAVFAAIAAIIGSVLGVAITRRIPERVFRIIISIMLLIIGIKMLI